MSAQNGQQSFNFSASGDNVAIPALAGKSIYVTRLKLSLAAQTTVQFKDGVTALSGPETCVAQLLDNQDGAPWYVTSPGSAFVISLGAAVQCGGTAWFNYQ